MRISAYILCIITLFMFLSGCNNVIQSESDEIIYYEWHVNNPSGIKALLDFDIEDNMITFEIIEDEHTKTKIEGRFSIDKNNIYIYDADILSIFTLEYKVFSDHLILKYRGEEIELIKKDCAKASNSP